MTWNKWTPKVGDEIVCIVDHGKGSAYSLNTVYVVKSIHRDNKNPGMSAVFTTFDDHGSTVNGWRLQFFRPATKAAEVLYTTKE